MPKPFSLPPAPYAAPLSTLGRIQEGSLGGIGIPLGGEEGHSMAFVGSMKMVLQSPSIAW